MPDLTFARVVQMKFLIVPRERHRNVAEYNFGSRRAQRERQFKAVHKFKSRGTLCRTGERILRSLPEDASPDRAVQLNGKSILWRARGYGTQPDHRSEAFGRFERAHEARAHLSSARV